MPTRKTIKLLLYISSIMFVSFSFGALSYRNSLFPIPQLRFLKNQLANTANAANANPSCPVVDPQKLSELNTISEMVEIRNIFWGNSLVEGMHDSRFYGINKYQEVAQSGQIVYCALGEMDYILNFSPESVLIYIGGNDADGQSWYGPEQAALYYEEIIDTLLANEIRPIIHLIHGGSTSRDRDYVTEYNQRLMQLARRKDISLIPDVKQFSFNGTRTEIRESNNPWSYDGEHLKAEGYKLWVLHIKEYIYDF